MFALGNKTYEHYNAMGKYVDKRLAELGAKRIFDLGMGDDDGKWVGDLKVNLARAGIPFITIMRL